jgi:hypothetical protein
MFGVSVAQQTSGLRNNGCTDADAELRSGTVVEIKLPTWHLLRQIGKAREVEHTGGMRPTSNAVGRDAAEASWQFNNDQCPMGHDWYRVGRAPC